MKAIVLVGGEGTRLRPLTYTVPKQMLPVAGVPLIERVVGHLSGHGISDVVLSLGYRPDAFLAAWPDGRCAGASLSYVVESEPLDTAGAVRYAAAKSGVDATFLVVNGDVLSDLDVRALVAFHHSHGGEGTIALTPVDDPSAFGVVVADRRGRVEAFMEKPAPGTAPTNLINAGTYVLEPSVVARIPDGGRTNIERQTFPALVDEGRLFASVSDGYWLDVGTPERYIQACADLLNGRRTGPPAPGAVSVAAHLWYIGSPMVEGTVLGPSLVGDRAFVAGAATVEGSVIGSGARVEAGATVSGSVVLSDAVVRSDARVADSVVGPGSWIGSGAKVTGGSVVGAGARVDDDASLVGARHPS